MRHTKPARGERGAIMIVTLLFLVILTMLGVTAMTGTTMEERMAGNTRDTQIALQAAEAALRDARRDINMYAMGASFGRSEPPDISYFGDNQVPGSCSPVNPGLCLPANDPDGTPYDTDRGAILPNPPARDMTGPPSVEYGQITGAQPLGGTTMLSRQPRYVMELFRLREGGESIGQEIPFKFVRVIAAGYGRNPNTVVTLHEVFVRE